MISKYWRPYLVLIIHYQSGAWFRIPSSAFVHRSPNQDNGFGFEFCFDCKKFQFRALDVSHWNMKALLGWDVIIWYDRVFQRTCTEKHPHRLRRLCDRTHCSAAKEIDLISSATIDDIHSVWALLTSDLDPGRTKCLLEMRHSSPARALYRH